jgi:serine/threonine protein kinase/Tol biopolymer transport system component
MTLESGTRLGPYHITAPIGAGGMGEVYLARDTQLDRDVAIKVLPDSVTGDPERIARFRREAKLLASLNHHNIAAVFGFDDVDGMSFLVMEYVEGQTLSQRLDEGALPIDEALDVAGQIAEALEEAHEHGIVHRDLKPGNVMITSVSKVKVLDFGLAKAMADDPTSTTTANSPTITANFTQPGVILGTAAYMSPEQARGRTIDRRSDIWSFGVVLYEMLTGISPFVGETISDSIGAILHKEVDLQNLPATATTSVRRVLTRCLERDRKQRLRDIGDARLDLKLDDAEPFVVPPLTRPSTSKAALAVLLVLGGVIGALLGYQAAWTSPPRVVHLSIGSPADVRMRYSGDLAGPAVVSPDGTKIAYAASRDGESSRLWVRDLSAPGAREIDGIDGALFPFWSPDSASLGFFTRDKLYRLDLDTGTKRTICDVADARGGCWTHDNRIILCPTFRGALVIVGADGDGGTPQPLTTLDEQHTTHRWPWVLPDGNRFLFLATNRARTQHMNKQGIYIGYLDGQPPQMLMQSEYGAQFVDDHVLFVRDEVLLASKVDLNNAALVGDLYVIARNVNADTGTWHSQFSASAGGVLAFNSSLSMRDGAMARTVGSFESEGDTVVQFSEQGTVLTHHADGVPHAEMVLAPDGRSFILSVPDETGELDLWLHPTTWTPDSADLMKRVSEVANRSPRRLTSMQGSEAYAVWSPDGSEIVFAQHDADDGTPGIYRKHIDGGRETLLLSAADVPAHPSCWTQDGKYIVYTRGSWQGTDENDIWVLPLDGGDPTPLVQSPVLDHYGQVSPDGRWLAYTQSMRGQVHVIPFAPAWEQGNDALQWQVSADGGIAPVWSRDGTKLYFVSRTSMLMEVTVDTTADSFSFSNPTKLFHTPFEAGSSFAALPPFTDGSRQFLFNDIRQSGDAPISVILNWDQLLKDE